MRCPARIAFEQTGDTGRSKSSAAALLGTTAHRALELVCLGTGVEEAWSAARMEMSETADGDPAALPGFRRLHLRYRRRANELVRYLAGHAELEPLPEQDLRSEDGVLRGQADLILLAADHLVVIDHKAGLVTQEDLPKEAYVRQVQIYAALASSQFKRPAVNAALFSLREGMIEVDVSKDAVDAAVDEARQLLSDFNQRAPGPQPANPRREACQWCASASKCDGLWEALDSTWVDEVGVCVRGELARAEVAENGSGSIELRVTEAFPADWESVLISGVPDHYVRALPPNGRVSITGLQRHFRNPEALVWKHTSLISGA